MRITKIWLIEENACGDGKKWWDKNPIGNPVKCINALIKNHLDWANWLVAHVLPRKKRIQYAIFAAEQVIDIFEKKYPDDKRPRQAIEAAKTYLKRPTKENQNAANAAAYAAYAAYGRQRRRLRRANAAAYAAYAAVYAAAYAAYAAVYAAVYAANAAAYAAANAAMKKKIIEYGIKLLGRK